MHDKNSSISLLKDALAPRGFTFQNITLGDPGVDFTTIISPQGNSVIVASENPVFPFNTCSARLVANDKLKAYDYAKHQDVAIPKTVIQKGALLTDESLQLLASSNQVIVKPKKGSGSKGLTIDVSTEEALQLAVTNALLHHKEVIIQEQFYGEEVRFVVINGKVEAALLREKPKVVGDGRSTIAELIAQEENERRAITTTLIPYPALDDVIPDKANTLIKSSVPATGEVCELSKGTMIKTGASIYNVYDTIHPDYLRLAEKLTSQFGKGFIVVDIMIEDLAAPAEDDGYVFIEFNLAPALSLFYSCRDGNHFNVVEEHLVQMIITLLDGSKGE